jgi:hypothetical protein
MEQAKAVVHPILSPRESFPAGSGVFLVIAALVTLAWMVFSVVYADVSRPAELRRVDGLWGWVILAMFQLLLQPRGSSAAVMRHVVLALVMSGVIFSAVRYSWEPESKYLHAILALAEAGMVTLAVIATSLRGMAHLTGRAVKAADIWMFVAMQWLLVWAAADLVLTWRNQGEPLIDMRRRLAEMMLFGAGVHTAIGLALTHLRGPHAGVRDRASLATLVIYNAGFILLLFDFRWGCVPMGLAITLFLVAASTLLRGDALMAPLLLLVGCMFIMSACVMRPFDSLMFAGWRHAIGGGCVAMCMIIALGVSANVKLPAKFQARGVIAIGAALFAIGVITRIVSEINDSADFGINKIAVVGTAFEVFGLVMVSFAAIRARGLRRNVGG